jgi:hypothetical protein
MDKVNLAQIFECAPTISPKTVKSGALKCACEDCTKSNKNSPMAMMTRCCLGEAAAAIWHDRIALYCPKCGKPVCQLKLATQ